MLAEVRQRPDNRHPRLMIQWSRHLIPQNAAAVEHAIALAGVTGTWSDVFAVQFTDRWFSVAPAPNARGTV